MWKIRQGSRSMVTWCNGLENIRCDPEPGSGVLIFRNGKTALAYQFHLVAGGNEVDVTLTGVLLQT